MVNFQVPNSITAQDMNYYPVTDGQTDRKRCIIAHRAICTARWAQTLFLFNLFIYLFFVLFFLKGLLSYQNKDGCGHRCPSSFWYETNSVHKRLFRMMLPISTFYGKKNNAPPQKKIGVIPKEGWVHQVRA